MKLSFNKRLQKICNKKNNHLCIGLDIDPERFPSGRDTSLQGMETFAKEVIDGTIELCPAYKPNFAFYEKEGLQGMKDLYKTIDYIKSVDSDIVIIADAKRGDIGNTSRQYAKAVLDNMGCDAITISPYLGRDSIEPFIKNPNKGVFILAVTSNPSAHELQEHGGPSNPLYKKVIQLAVELNSGDNIGLVVGATQIEVMEDIRKQSKGMPWLIPGVGSQGGELETALNISHENGMGIINVSRGILYAGNGSMKAVIQSARDYSDKIRGIVWNPVNC